MLNIIAKKYLCEEEILRSVKWDIVRVKVLDSEHQESLCSNRSSGFSCGDFLELDGLPNPTGSLMTLVMCPLQAGLACPKWADSVVSSISREPLTQTTLQSTLHFLGFSAIHQPM